MALYRCALCGSSHVIKDIKKEGYDAKKGMMGVAFFGVAGAVAGINEKNVITYKCADCGQTLSYCMNDYEKQQVESALQSRDNFYALDRLTEIKKKYPNIEWNESEGLEVVKRKNAESFMFWKDEEKVCIDFIKRHKIVSQDELFKELKRLGYPEKIIFDAPKNLALISDIPLKLFVENGELYYSFSSNNELARGLSNSEIEKEYNKPMYDRINEEKLQNLSEKDLPEKLIEWIGKYNEKYNRNVSIKKIWNVEREAQRYTLKELEDVAKILSQNGRLELWIESKEKRFKVPNKKK